MKTPICSICLQSDILCQSCSNNVASGRLSREGADIIKKLYQMSKEIKSLANVTVEKVLTFESLVVIIVPKRDVPGIVGKEGRIAIEVKRQFGKQIKVVGDGDYKTMISGLMYPAKIESIGKLYSNGKESLKINLRRGELRNLPARKEDLLKAAEEISGRESVISVN
ncbi:MAG: hypothetical protein V1836_03395 [Candidatus Aenigmatarchaeota archaeon]